MREPSCCRTCRWTCEQAAIFPVFFYADKFQAYRSDRFENFTTQPAEGGAIIEQSGSWGLHSAHACRS